MYIFIAESTVLLCDFQREKVWGEWISKTDNGCLGIKEDVLFALRAIANTPSEEECSLAIASLQKRYVWKSSPKLQRWFENVWLPEKKVQQALLYRRRDVQIKLTHSMVCLN